jgi:hypothetical protein
VRWSQTFPEFSRAIPRSLSRIRGLTYDFPLYDWAIKFIGIFDYSCLVPPGMLLTACSEKSFVV